MLISRVSGDDGWRRKGRGDQVESVGNAHEYQTASELFDMMARTHKFNNDENETLTTRDLVLLYKNIDLGTNLMSTVNEFKKRAPNQYVETIVYEDLESDTDLSEICSSEDLRNVMLINNERINILSRSSSFENTLCHKCSDIELRCSDLTVNYDNFVFKNPYMKGQLKSYSKELDKTILPVSLWDYICCKRSDDNYNNFYMENIIRYVKHTIEQLQRISNGDYLTEKVKEKWREVDNKVDIKRAEINDVHAIADTTCIPLYVERKVSGLSTKWDALIHSSFDIKSISKILEKKIIIEVPKALCGSYKLCSKYYNDNLIIRCKKDILPLPAPKETTAEKSLVDVVLHLNRSESGPIISNISSIMILQKPEKNDLWPLLVTESFVRVVNTREEKVTEIKMGDNNKHYGVNDDHKNDEIYENGDNLHSDSPSDSSLDSAPDSPCRNKTSKSSKDHLPGPTNSNYAELFKNFGSGNGAELPFFILPSDELRMNILKLNIQALPEENTEDNPSSYNKKRSPTRRIKSPYENKSVMIEEKKRRKLLEIRQRREKKKLALSVEACKVIKHPVPPQTANPQTANSVTKLSITNKSFYNSIYGQNPNMEIKPSKLKNRKERKEFLLEGASDVDMGRSMTSDDNNQKYVNKSYYLDNADTEIMYMDMKEPEMQEPASESVASSNDMKVNLKLLSQLMVPSVLELTTPDLADETPPEYVDENEEIEDKEKETSFPSICLEHAGTPNNSPLNTVTKSSEKDLNEKEQKRVNTTSEFKKSIDKIYELIQKIGNSEGNETKLCKSKFTAVTERGSNYKDLAVETSTVQCSDSGTSVKHHLTPSSNPSCFSFGKSNTEEAPIIKPPIIKPPKKSTSAQAGNVVPKIIISAKSERDRKKFNPKISYKNAAENPLKTLSQLLHEFDSVQKTRSKTVADKVPKKTEVSFADVKVDNRTLGKKTSKMDTRTEFPERKNARLQRDRRYKPPLNVQQPILAESKPGTRALKKKVLDIVDEMKEARGEAVRGPCKHNTERLNSLAQPKKIYVQAQIEDFQARYGKSFVTDRLQRLNGTPVVPGPPSKSPSRASSPYKLKKQQSRISPEATKQTHSPPPASVAAKFIKRLSSNNSRETKQKQNYQSCKQHNVDTNTSTVKIAPVQCSIPTLAFTDYDDNMCTGQKLRVPYMPNDIELGSAVSSVDGSSTIGSKIHQMIDVMIPASTPSLENTENMEIITNLKEEPLSEKIGDKHQPLKPPECSNYHERPKIKIYDHIIGDTIPEENDSSQEIKDQSPVEIPNDINTRLETVNHVLCGNMSVGNLQKRLKFKNAKLNPEKTLQQVLLLQSGDSKSLILRSSISQNLKIKKSDGDLKTLPELAKIDWSFTQFPMQMPIVAYSFPQYHNYGTYIKPTQAEQPTNSGSADKGNYTNDKTIQCYKGGQLDTLPEASLREKKDVLAFSSVLKISSTLLEEPEEYSEFTISPQTKTNDVLLNTNVDDNISLAELDEHCKKLETKNSKINIIEEHVAKLSKESVTNTSKGLIAKTSVNKVSTECLSVTPRMDYTTSLDVLVGLLNEIQNITTCQSHMANTNEEDTDKQNEDMEAILKSAAALEHIQQEARNIISITSLDKLRQLESNTSMISFYVSSANNKDVVDKRLTTPLLVDKEISAMIPMDFVNKCTDVPSRFFPLTVTHSTNVTNSLVGVLSQPSSHSILNYNDHSDTSLIPLKKVINVPKNVKEDEAESSVIFIKHGHQVKEGNYKKVLNNKLTLHSTSEEKKPFILKKDFGKIYATNSDFDPIIKIKRDILVTVYSILVLTVFAALSFPDILYRA